MRIVRGCKRSGSGLYDVEIELHLRHAADEGIEEGGIALDGGDDLVDRFLIAVRHGENADALGVDGDVGVFRQTLVVQQHAVVGLASYQPMYFWYTALTLCLSVP